MAGLALREGESRPAERLSSAVEETSLAARGRSRLVEKWGLSSDFRFRNSFVSSMG